MPKRKTHEKYIEEIFNLVGNEYSVLGQYVNSTTKIKFKHNICGNEYETRAGSFLSGRRCPYCYGTHKKTTEQFQKELDELHPNEYKVVGEYQDAHTPILIKHIACGKTYDVAPHSILRGAYCRYCSNKASRTESEFIDELHSLVGDEYSLIGKYIDMSTKALFKHNICGHEWLVKPTQIITVGSRCPKCFAKNIKWSV